MRVVAVTEQGRRENNEDNFFKYRNDKFFGGMVADGMGGHNKGDVASKMAVDIVKDYIMMNFETDMDSFGISELMRTAIIKANEKIHQMAVKNPICVGMGTTATLAMVFKNWLVTAHVGDSRAYIIGKNGIEKITKDHSYVSELVERGVISEEEGKYHPKRNCITRAVGTERSIMVDINVREYNGETVVLCTDGLWAYVEDEKILELIRDNPDIEVAAEYLVEMAILKNSSDNITAVIFNNQEQ